MRLTFAVGRAAFAVVALSVLMGPLLAFERLFAS